MISTELLQTFLQEAQDLLEQLEQALLDLGNTPDDPRLIDSAFRALHTIKGSGAMCGFTALAAFVHHVESAFDKVRKGEARVSNDLISVVLAARDQMRILIDDPENANPTTGRAILENLQRVIGGPNAQMQPHAKDEAGGADNVEHSTAAELGWRIVFQLSAQALANGTNPLLLLDELRSQGSAVVTASDSAVPDLETIDPTGCYLSWTVLLQTAANRSAIEQVFLFLFDEMQLTITPLDAVHAAPAPPASPPPPAAQTHDRPPNQQQANDKPAAERRQVANNASIRVPAERLDELMDRVGELVIAQSRLKQVAAASRDPTVQSAAEEIERLSLELRDSTMSVRMLPIGSLFSRFRRLVHDLARDLGKQIELVTQGEETELDKTVIERLNDPMVHLIRNSIDHGLEEPEGRQAAGKPEFGRITLTARHAGAEVLISINDDGRGLDRARIRARAEENGIVPVGAKLTDQELFHLIFQPGFSTAREVTSLSGRGVGMDVVKRAIEALRGTIDISSTAGHGSTMTLRLPLTLAIIDGLLVRVGSGRYVIPLSAVEECVELSAADDSRSRGRSFLNIRGDLVPFLRLREMFGVATAADRYQKVVIVSTGDLRVGLVVDQVIGDHQTVIESLSKLHADVEIFSGATILGDGTVSLILDVAHLVEHGQRHTEKLKLAS